MVPGLQSPILKFLPDNAIEALLKRTKATSGSLIFFGADKAKIVNEALGALRLKIGTDMKLVQKGWKPLWIVDYPMFEWDETEKRWTSLHHPFTAPNESDIENLEANLGTCLSRAYDMVLNGEEIGGGSIRIQLLFPKHKRRVVYSLLPPLKRVKRNYKNCIFVCEHPNLLKRNRGHRSK